jgi:23S rRNA-/tRNA-specific pseudouridylate synthase
MGSPILRGLERAPANAEIGDVFCSVYTPSPSVPLSVPTSLPSLEAPLGLPVIYHLLVPCGLQNVERANPTILDLIAKHTPLPERYIKELCSFGALFVRVGPRDSRVSPKPPRVTRIEQLLEPLPAEVPIYVRIHANPRRHQPLWDLTVLWDDGDLVVVNKPAGIPTIPAIDNAFECALSVAEILLRESNTLTSQEHLRVTSRLDVGTSGAVIFARSKTAVSTINRALKENNVVKRYAVLSRNRPSCGLRRHMCRKDPSRGRGLLAENLVLPWDEATVDLQGWCVAELVVETVETVCGGAAWESIVRLVTGRTHQIRLQFAAEGWWVWGDAKYEAVGGNGSIASGGLLGDSSNLHGLHAMYLQFLWQGENVSVCAGRPWWRDDRLEPRFVARP